MDRFIPREKLSKKARRELDRAKRKGWNGIRPVTKKIESKKRYQRKKPSAPIDIDFAEGFFMEIIC